MRVFVAGASGVIGVHVVPLLVGAGHEVAGMTRSPEKVEMLRKLGAEPVVGNVFDADRLRAAVAAFKPEMVMHQLTDLPDDPALISDHVSANARIRREGTVNLLNAARAAGAERFLAQSVAWELDGEGEAAVRFLERAVLDAGGVVLRYGRLYGPGTFHGDQVPPPPRIHLDEAARHTLDALDAEPSVIVVAEPTDSTL